MLAAENWCVKVDEKIYGPYSTAQMRKLAHEGRLAHWSLVSPAGARSWREAREEIAFASFFGFEAPTRIRRSRAFGKRELEAAETDAPVFRAGSAVARPAPAPINANFVIVFDVVSGAASRVEAAVTGLGSAFRIADNVWSLSCDLTAAGVRNAIAPYLLGRESIFVVDASRGRTSWQNYCPEAHAKISASYLSARTE